MIKPEDIEVSIYPDIKSKGGQHVGLTSSGVLIMHKPSGLGIVSTSERSQYKNKELALVVLELVLELNDLNVKA